MILCCCGCWKKRKENKKRERRVRKVKKKTKKKNNVTPVRTWMVVTHTETKPRICFKSSTGCQHLKMWSIKYLIYY